MKELTKQLESGGDLSEDQVKQAVEELLDESITNPVKADFLEALSRKGETPAEIVAFVQAFLSRAVKPELGDIQKPVIDVCGTGGDGAGLFNVSSAVVFVLAAGGCAVAKHGNRAVTSKSGSADVLEALDINIEMDSESAGACLREVGAAFLFAPEYHPAFREVAPVRKILARRGSRSIFNLMGPLINPLCPSYQLVGIFDPSLGAAYAEILKLLGRKKAWVCHGVCEQSKQGMDEFCSVGSTRVWTTDKGKLEVDASVLGIRGGTVEDLKGGTARQNAKIIIDILEGVDKGPKRDMVVLNAAAALVIAGIATDIRNGLEISRQKLDSGEAREVLERWREWR